MDKTSEKERIKKMIEVVMNVAMGDYSHQINLSGENNDLDSLAMGLNMMIDDIKNTIVKDKKRATELEKTHQELQEETTERKKAEENLRQNQIFLDSVVENIPNMVFVKDAKE